MSRTLKSLQGSGVGGAWVDGDKFKLTPHYQPLKDDLDLLMLGVLGRNVYGGGDENFSFDVGAGTGWLTALNSLEFEIDNAGSQVSAATNLVCRVRLMLRVETGGITVTPRVYNVSDASVPTQSGAAATSGTDQTFTGTNQRQTLTFTPASGKKKYVVQVQKSADDEPVWCARIGWDVYIDS